MSRDQDELQSEIHDGIEEYEQAVVFACFLSETAEQLGATDMDWYLDELHLNEIVDLMNR